MRSVKLTNLKGEECHEIHYKTVSCTLKISMDVTEKKCTSLFSTDNGPNYHDIQFPW